MNPAHRSALAVALALLAASAGHAATYFVDADAGLDTADGLSATPIAGTATGAAQGPWQTVARVNTAALQPGDTVLFRCGQSWRETLRVLRTGAAGQPLTFGSYPGNCANKPMFDASIPVQADEWELHQGQIWKLRLPVSVLPQGRLNQTTAGWRTASAKGDARLAFNPACPAAAAGCGSFTAGAEGALAISPAFALRAGKTYTVRFEVLAAAGHRYGGMVRRFTAPYTAQSGYAAGVGNGAWQQVEWTFTATGNINDARVDIDMPGRNATTHLRNVRVEPELANANVLHAFMDGAHLNPARHPNPGYKPSAPTSQYLSAGVADSLLGTDGRRRSSYINTRSDLVLPAGAALTPGMTAWVRSQNWSLGKHEVTAVNGNRLSISPLTAYPLNYNDWGYFLTGAQWMLDAPGEWYFDPTTRYFYVWMPDGAKPGAQVRLGLVENAIHIGDTNRGIFPAHIAFENLAIRGYVEGVNASRAVAVALRKVDFSHITGFAVDADGVAGLRVESSTFRNILSDSIHAVNATDAVIVNNDITNNGVVVNAAGKVESSPRESYSAIMTGARSTIKNNRLTNIAYNGIFAPSDSVVSENVVRNFSLTLNDAGGIYSAGTVNAKIQNNVVLDGIGNRDGVPAVLQTLVSSVYLDGNTGNLELTGNTLSNADHCLQLHDGYDSLVSGNTCFGTRRNSIRMQESTAARRATGDTYGNRITNNHIFQTASGSHILQSTRQADVAHFGVFDGNAYSALVSPTIAKESWSNGQVRTFTLEEWKLATSSSGLRGLEAAGTLAAPVSAFARGSFGASMVPALLEFGGGWSRSTGTADMQAGCGPKSEACINLVAGTSGTSFSSPRFSVSKDQWYRVSFDAKVSDAAQAIKVLVMRSSSPYESVMGLEPFEFSAGTTWRRYAFYFKGTADALRTATVAGARMDIFEVLAGRSVTVANFEIAPMTSKGGEPSMNLMVNSDATEKALDCPTRATAPLQCGSFFAFPSGARVNWPMRLAAFRSQVVFTQDDTLPDADGDGIGNEQDLCPNTARGAAVNLRGCALTQ